MRFSYLIVFIRLSAASPDNSGPKSAIIRSVATEAFDAGASKAFPLDSSIAPTKNPDVYHVRNVQFWMTRIETNDTGTFVHSLPQNPVNPTGGKNEIVILDVACWLDYEDYIAVE
jgi:hypothetical protein